MIYTYTYDYSLLCLYTSLHISIIYCSTWYQSGFESVSRKLGFKEIRVLAAARSTIPTLLFRHSTRIIFCSALLRYSAQTGVYGVAALLCPNLGFYYYSALLHSFSCCSTLPNLGFYYYYSALLYSCSSLPKLGFPLLMVYFVQPTLCPN